jgi:hypothetical protein
VRVAGLLVEAGIRLLVVGALRWRETAGWWQSVRVAEGRRAALAGAGPVIRGSSRAIPWRVLGFTVPRTNCDKRVNGASNSAAAGKWS